LTYFQFSFYLSDWRQLKGTVGIHDLDKNFDILHNPLA